MTAWIPLLLLAGLFSLNRLITYSINIHTQWVTAAAERDLAEQAEHDAFWGPVRNCEALQQASAVAGEWL